jgi:hypothetical protein
MHSPWRDVLPIHPAAELFPLMSEVELRELANDIKAHGLRTPIVIWESEDENDRRAFLLDGRNRLDAAALAGLLDLDEHGRLCLGTSDGLREIKKQVHRPHRGMLFDADPYALAVSLNIHRRHLTAEQKRELIEKLLKAKPEQSNLTIAKQVKADDKTVAKIRHGLEARSEIPNVEVRIDTRGRKQPAKKKKAKPAPTAKPNPITSAWDKADREMRYEFIQSRGEEIVGYAFDVEAGTDMPVTTAVERAVGRQRGRAS